MQLQQADLFSNADAYGDNVGESFPDQTLTMLRARIRDELLAHLDLAGIRQPQGQPLPMLSPNAKAEIRAQHALQRAEYRQREMAFVLRYGRHLLRHFADGCEVQPERIDPVLCPVIKEGEDAALFRFATLLWSVPVSRGYGRRMRFLVRDRTNGKLIGLFSLADPVFNLRARDTWIGWSVDDRRQRLVNVMDANVVGAVPPYTHLLGGKLVASLMTSREVCDEFAARYADTRGIISKQTKRAQLLLITVTSALGRSSLYNRLKLAGLMEFVRVGKTEGWGHFQVPNNLFLHMRHLLQLVGHPYASGHQFGQGPNWRMRVAREALKEVGLDPDLLRHGISREVYAAALAPGWREYLCGGSARCSVERPAAGDIAAAAVSRWMVPRAARAPEYRVWTREDAWEALVGSGLGTGGQ